jgi:hypothetical protein
MTVTYGTATLTLAGKPTVTPPIIVKKTHVFGAMVGNIQEVTTNIQQALGSGVTVALKCTTTDLDDYTDLLELAGTLQTLTLEYSETYLNMAITRLSRPEIGKGVWTYEVEFEQHTA